MTSALKIARLLALPLVLGAAACDNPVEHEEHPEGLVVLNASGTEVSRYMVDTGTATADIAVGVDVSTTFTVQAVGEDGDVIVIDGDELALELDAMRPGWTASLTGANQLVITATAVGDSPLTITLLHEGHQEFKATFDVVAQ